MFWADILASRKVWLSSPQGIRISNCQTLVSDPTAGERVLAQGFLECSLFDRWETAGSRCWGCKSWEMFQTWGPLSVYLPWVCVLHHPPTSPPPASLEAQECVSCRGRRASVGSVLLEANIFWDWELLASSEVQPWRIRFFVSSGFDVVNVAGKEVVIVNASSPEGQSWVPRWHLWKRHGCVKLKNVTWNQRYSTWLRCGWALGPTVSFESWVRKGRTWLHTGKQLGPYRPKDQL